MSSKLTQRIAIKIENVSVLYRSDIYALKDLSLEISKGKFFTILGPSGSGKSSVLLAIAGLLDPQQAQLKGSIKFDGSDVSQLPANERDVPLVFQNYALFPHMTVFENIAFPLRVRKIDKQKLKMKVEEVLNLVKLQGYESRFPVELSGGQKQRVALARALVIEPRTLLLDEPLGALDRKLRDQMQVEIKNLQEQLGITVVYVTHDQTEALALSDKIAILNNGNLMQSGSPLDIYENPSNAFVADFVGESNLLEGTVQGVNKKNIEYQTTTGLKFKASNQLDVSIGSRTRVLIRPENITFIDSRNNTLDNIVEGFIKECFYLGDRIRYQIMIDTNEIINLIVSGKNNGLKQSKGERVKIGWTAESTRLIKT